MPVIALFSWLISFSLLRMPDWTGAREQPLPAFVYVLPDVLAAAVVLTGWIIFRRHVHDDDEYRKNPVTPEWRRLRPDSRIIEKMLETAKMTFAVVLFICGLIAVFVVYSFFDNNVHDRYNQIGTAIALAILLLVILCTWLRIQFWKHPPEELDYTEIPVAYCTEHLYHVRGGERKRIKLYFFLPNGRHRVVLDSLYPSTPAPDTLYFVRLHGVVWWIHWEDI